MLSAFPFLRLRFSLSDCIDQLTTLTKCNVVIFIDADKDITRLSNNNVITLERVTHSSWDVLELRKLILCAEYLP